MSRKTHRPRVTRFMLEGALRACEHALNADWDDGDLNQAKIAEAYRWLEAMIAWFDESVVEKEPSE